MTPAVGEAAMQAVTVFSAKVSAKVSPESMVSTDGFHRNGQGFREGFSGNHGERCRNIQSVVVLPLPRWASPDLESHRKATRKPQRERYSRRDWQSINAHKASSTGRAQSGQAIGSKSDGPREIGRGIGRPIGQLIG